ncbi:TPA: hypothetical protein ACGD5E_000918 [Serratia marcescens]
MDADLISYETMLATRDSAVWAFWTMLMAATSTLLSLATILIAIYALKTWKQQEILKAKMEFKKVLMQLRHVVLFLPDRVEQAQVVLAKNILSDTTGIKTRGMEQEHIEAYKDLAREIRELENEILNCWKTWMSTEDIFRGSEIEVLWKEVQKNHNAYMLQGGDKQPYLESVDTLMKKDFVFR